jgi:hypothetical protein
MMQGRRPIRSDRLPTNGMSSTATRLPDTEIHRYMVVVKPMPYSSLVAYAAPKIVATVGTAFISAMQMTRSMSGPFSRTTCAIGAWGTSPSPASSRKAGVSSTLRRIR